MACYNSELPIGPPGPQGPPGPSGISTINVQQAAPTTTNDVSEGYVVGSTWFDETTSNFYICSDNTLNAAVWDLIGGLSGSWTGTITGPSGATFIPNTGRYSVVGNVVTCTCRIQIIFSGISSLSYNLSLPIPPPSVFNDNLQLCGVGGLLNYSGTQTPIKMSAESQPGGFNAYVYFETAAINSDTFTYNLMIQYTI